MVAYFCKQILLTRELNRTICTLIMCICNMNFIVRSLFLLRDTTTMLRININKLHAEKNKLHVNMNSPVHIFYLACRWRKHVTIPIVFFWKGGGGQKILKDIYLLLHVLDCWIRMHCCKTRLNIAATEPTGIRTIGWLASFSLVFNIKHSELVSLDWVTCLALCRVIVV